MNLRLTGLKFLESDDAVELNEHSLMQMMEVVHPADSSRIAYKFVWGGREIAWLPEVESIRRYYREATTKDDRDRIEAWGKGIKQMRVDLGADTYNIGRKWMVPIARIVRNQREQKTEIYIKWERNKGEA